MLSFGLLLLIILTMTALEISELRDFDKRFKDFNVVSQDSNSLQKLDRDFSGLERNILVFSNGGKLSNSIQMREYYAILIADIEELVNNNSFEKIAHKKSLLQLYEVIKSFDEKIISLEELKKEREDIVNTALNDLYQTINEEMISLFSSLSKNSNKNVSMKVLEAHLNISKIEV